VEQVYIIWWKITDITGICLPLHMHCLIESTRVKLQCIIIAGMCSNYRAVLYDYSIPELCHHSVPFHFSHSGNDRLKPDSSTQGQESKSSWLAYITSQCSLIGCTLLFISLMNTVMLEITSMHYCTMEQQLCPKACRSTVTETGRPELSQY